MSKHPVDRLHGLCVITGASTGIGFELAQLVAKDGCDLILASDTDQAEIVAAAKSLGAGEIEAVQCDLSTDEGIDRLLATIAGRQVDVLIANAGESKGGAFLNQTWNDVERTIDTNIKSTVRLVHEIGGSMRLRDSGRILVTGSIVGHMPGPFNLTYNSTKAFVDDFCVGLAEELKDSKVVVTCLLPGATDTPFFAKAGMEDTKVGKAPKADPARVAKDGYEALLKGDTLITSGFKNKVQKTFADLLPEELVAKMHRRMAEPESAKAAEPA